MKISKYNQWQNFTLEQIDQQLGEPETTSLEAEFLCELLDIRLAEIGKTREEWRAEKAERIAGLLSYNKTGLDCLMLSIGIFVPLGCGLLTRLGLYFVSWFMDFAI